MWFNTLLIAIACFYSVMLFTTIGPSLAMWSLLTLILGIIGVIYWVKPK